MVDTLYKSFPGWGISRANALPDESMTDSVTDSDETEADAAVTHSLLPRNLSKSGLVGPGRKKRAGVAWASARSPIRHSDKLTY